MFSFPERRAWIVGKKYRKHPSDLEVYESWYRTNSKMGVQVEGVIYHYQTCYGRRCGVPHYEFICHDCHKGFLKTLSQRDYEEGEFTCPHCGSNSVKLRVALPDAATKKSA